MFCIGLLGLWNTYSVRDGEDERENGGYALVGSEEDDMQDQGQNLEIGENSDTEYVNEDNYE